MSLLKRLIRVEWKIGFINNSIEDVLSGKDIEFKWVVNPYKNRWFADPFLLDVTETSYIVLAEDYEYSKGYACISKLTIRKDTCEIIEAKKILDNGTHMSFPVIIRKNEEVYVHPENSVSGKLSLYKYNKEKDQLEFQSVMADLPLTDAVTLENDAVSTMFATLRNKNPNGNILYLLERGGKKYNLSGKIVLDSNVARMAGNFFCYDGRCYRPAQDCNDRYGGALIIQEMKKDGDLYKFLDIRRIISTHNKLKLGLHTFNIYKNVIVIDVYGYSGIHYVSAFINKIRYLILKK